MAALRERISPRSFAPIDIRLFKDAKVYLLEAPGEPTFIASKHWFVDCRFVASWRHFSLDESRKSEEVMRFFLDFEKVDELEVWERTAMTRIEEDEKVETVMFVLRGDLSRWVFFDKKVVDFFGVEVLYSNGDYRMPFIFAENVFGIMRFVFGDDEDEGE